MQDGATVLAIAVPRRAAAVCRLQRRRYQRRGRAPSCTGTHES